MILILGIPLFVVNLFVMGKSVKEGMENSKSSDNNDSKSNENTSQDPSNNTVESTINKINEKVATKQGLPITPVDDDNTSSNSNGKIAEESFEVGRNKKGKYDIDYASTIEDAYDELNKIIGGDGIKKLTGDTQNLMKQQLQLAEAMKSMGPLVEQMGPLMQSVGPMIDQAKGLMGSGGNNIADLARGFTAGSKK
jgi:cytoskeletal protein RodZ